MACTMDAFHQNLGYIEPVPPTKKELEEMRMRLEKAKKYKQYEAELNKRLGIDDALKKKYESLCQHHYEVETECENLRKIINLVLQGVNINDLPIPSKSKDWEYNDNK